MSSKNQLMLLKERVYKWLEAMSASVYNRHEEMIVREMPADMIRGSV